jgi:hypothetical protein
VVAVCQVPGGAQGALYTLNVHWLFDTFLLLYCPAGMKFEEKSYISNWRANFIITLLNWHVKMNYSFHMKTKKLLKFHL